MDQTKTQAPAAPAVCCEELREKIDQKIYTLKDGILYGPGYGPAPAKKAIRFCPFCSKLYPGRKIR